MKPCLNNRESLALLAANSLDARSAQALRAHISTCNECQSYLAELTAVTDKLTSFVIKPEVQASAAFHQKLVNRLRTQEKIPAFSLMKQWLGLPLSGRIGVALAGAAAFMVIVFLLDRSPHPITIARAVPPSIHSVSPIHDRDLAPTVSNYEMVASGSLDKLDDLLTRQGERHSERLPVYTASAFSHALLSE